MTDVKTYPGTLYSYTTGSYVGVLITEAVLKKLAALHAEHLEKVKRVLADAGPDQVFPSMWSLHYPNGYQTQVDYIDTTRTLEECLKGATWLNQPRACFPVFIAGSMKEAEAMADARFATHAVAAAETAP